MSETFIKEIVAGILKQDRPISLHEVHEAMGRYGLQTPKRFRDLKWKRFVQNSPLPMPQLMKDSVESIIDSYKMNFAQYAATGANNVKKVVQNFQGLVFSWYTEDPAVSHADYADMKKDMKGAMASDPARAQEIAKLKKIADFIQEKGIQLLQPGENLTDLHLSDCGFAFQGIVPVKRGDPSLAHSNEETDPESWEQADALAKSDPNKSGRIAQITVGQNSKGHFMVVARRKNEDGSFVDEPYLNYCQSKGSKFNWQDKEHYKISFKKVMRGQIVPNSSYVYLPEGDPKTNPNGRVELVAGRPAKRDRLMDEKAVNQLKMYQRPDGSVRVYSEMMQDPAEAPHVYKVMFDGPEGGFLALQVSTGKAVPFSQQQVQQMLSRGELPDGQERTDPHDSFMLLTPPRIAKNWLSDEEKPAGFGRWDMMPEDRDKVRAMFKNPFDQLADLLNKYRSARISDKGELSKKIHTPSQSYTYVVVAPRHAVGEIADDKGRGVQKIINKKYRVRPDGMPETSAPEAAPAAVPAPAAPQPMAPVAVSLYDLMKEAAPRGLNYEQGLGERNWVCVVHDVKTGELADHGNKRFPYETMSGEPGQGFDKLPDAIDYAMKRLGIGPDKQKYVKPSKATIDRAEAALAAAKGEIQSMGIQPSDQTPEAQQLMAEKQKRIQLSEQSKAAEDQGTTIEPDKARTLLTVNEGDYGTLFDNIDGYDQEATADTEAVEQGENPAAEDGAESPTNPGAPMPLQDASDPAMSVQEPGLPATPDQSSALSTDQQLQQPVDPAASPDLVDPAGAPVALPNDPSAQQAPEAVGQTPVIQPPAKKRAPRKPVAPVQPPLPPATASVKFLFKKYGL